MFMISFLTLTFMYFAHTSDEAVFMLALIHFM